MNIPVWMLVVLSVVVAVVVVVAAVGAWVIIEVGKIKF